MSLSYSDWIPEYPDIDDPKISLKLAAKKEFEELQGAISEPVPAKGQGYSHQKYMVRLLRHYDSILNISEPGTGKSCTFVGVAEYYKKHSSQIKHVYVLQKGPSTVNDFKHQIVCRCTAGEYETEMVRRADRDTTRKSNLTRELSKWYTISTYKSFTSKITGRRDKDGTVIQSPMTDDEIRDEFNGCLFLVDEAHNLRNESSDDKDDVKKACREMDTVYNVLWRVFHLIQRSKIVLATATPMINEVREIPRMMNLILPADNQMPLNWDYTFVTLKQMEPFFRGRVAYVRGLETGARVVFEGDAMPIGYKIDLPKEEWDPDRIGKIEVTADTISEAKAEQPKPDKGEIETEIVTSQVMVHTCTMSPFQEEVYKGISGEETFLTHKRQASNFVFPDGSYGGKSGSEHGFGKYVIAKSESDYALTKEFKKFITGVDEDDYSNLWQCSTKMYDVIANEIAVADQRDELAKKARLAKRGEDEWTEEDQEARENLGNAFVFHEFVEGGGAILMGLILEAFGWERYNQTSSVFRTSAGKGGSICDTSGTRTIDSKFERKKRYALLTGSTSDRERDSLLELFNSDENRHGDYCQIVIGTPTSRDGINLYNCLRCYLFSAGWNPSGMHQAFSRVLRATSHEALLNEKRERMASEGKDSSQASIKVSIYRMAAVGEDYFTEENLEYADIHLYKRSEEKDLHIRRIMKFLKQCAVDCVTHYNRNVRQSEDGEGDVDNSAACDYGKCRYICSGADKPGGVADLIPEEDIDYGSYDVLYSDSVISHCESEIVKIMRNHSTITLEELYSLWVPELYRTKKYIHMAISNIISTKRALTDRFGFRCYLHTDGHNLFTQREFPVSGSVDRTDLAYYGKQLVGLSRIDFSDIVGLSQGPRFDQIVDNLGMLAEEMDELAAEDEGKPEEEKENTEEILKRSILFDNQLLRELPVERRVALLEKSVLNLYLDMGDSLSDHVTQRLFVFLKKVREPTADIEATKIEQSSGSTKGRKPKDPSKATLKAAEHFIGEGDDDDEVVYVHVAYNSKIDMTSYGTSSQLKNIDKVRILKPSESPLQWRDTLPHETPAYSHIMRDNIDAYFDKFKDESIYGTILMDGAFRIIDRRDEVSKKVSARAGNRAEHHGQRCTTMTKPKLISIATKLKFLPAQVEEKSVEVDTSREGMIAFLAGHSVFGPRDKIDSYTDEDLLNMCKWWTMTKTDICAMIQTHLYQRDKILMI